MIIYLNSKVEGSNPGAAVSFSSRNTQLKAGAFGQEYNLRSISRIMRMRDSRKRLLRMREKPRFSENSIETDLLGGLRNVTSVYAWTGLEKGGVQSTPHA